MRLLVPMMDARNQRIFRETGGADFSYSCAVDGTAWRFRVNVLTQLGNIGLVARRINNWIPDFAGLHLPASVEQLCNFDQGLVLLAGVTGSGKTTTIASMLNYINHKYRKHILTLEDPIEFIYTPDKCLINQREIGMDVLDFAIGMKHAVREDPDVMLVGEMRDEETFLTAIHAAETGHLVYGTIHASSAATTIGRILDLFPEAMHGAIRSAIAFNAGHRGPETAEVDQAGGRARAGGRDHVLQPDRPEADPGGRRPEAARRHPHRRRGGHAGFHDEPEAAGGRGTDRSTDGLRGRPEPAGVEDGPQRDRCPSARHTVTPDYSPRASKTLLSASSSARWIRTSTRFRSPSRRYFKTSTMSRTRTSPRPPPS